MKLTGENRNTRGEKTCPNTTLPTTNPTQMDPGSNPGLRSDRPATNCLSHGTALVVLLSADFYCQGSLYLARNKGRTLQ
jgi:hypothetical protein